MGGSFQKLGSEGVLGRILGSEAARRRRKFLRIHYVICSEMHETQAPHTVKKHANHIYNAKESQKKIRLRRAMTILYHDKYFALQYKLISTRIIIVPTMLSTVVSNHTSM